MHARHGIAHLARLLVLILVSVAAVSAVIYFSFDETVQPGGTMTAASLQHSPAPAPDSISVNSLYICPSDCLYASPYVSGLVLVNGTTQLLSLTVYVNGTLDGIPIDHTADANNTMTVFAYQYKGSVPGTYVPIITGDTYVFKFVAVFEDGTRASTTYSVVATS